MAETERELLTKKAVDAFMNRWTNDPSFIHQLKADPKAALKSCGIEPWDQVVESLKDLDLSIPLAELKKTVFWGISMN